MDKNYVLIAGVVAFAIASLFFILKKIQSKNLNNLLLSKQFAVFDKQVNSKLSKILFSKFTLLNYQLSKAFLVSDTKQIESLFVEIDRGNINPKARKNIYMQAFNYYIAANNQEQSKFYLDKIEEMKDPDFSQEANIIYDVYMNKGDQYLDLLLNKIENTEEVYAGIDEFLVSKIYENRNDKKKANEYLSRSRQHLKEMDKLIAEKNRSKK